MSIYIYLLIAITGILTTYTDIRKGKIKNTHLIVILGIAIVLYSVFFAIGTFKLSLALIINLATGLMLGFVLYTFGTWKAGDAKLFFLYCFLLMQDKNAYVLFLPCFALFANIFLISFIAMLPLSIRDIVYHRKDFFKYMISRQSLTRFIKMWAIFFSLSFFIGPLVAKYIPQNNTIVLFGFILLSYFLCRLATKAKYMVLLILILLTGIITKSLFMPEVISLKQIIDFIKYTTGYLIITLILAYIISSEKNKYTRVPFAPFMLLGAAVSTTKFLEFLMAALRNLR